jgi:hypothetical protein
VFLTASGKDFGPRHFTFSLLSSLHSLLRPHAPSHEMMLPSSTINSIKSNLGNAVSARNPQAVANAVELPSLHRPAKPSGGSGGSQATSHREQLKVDGVDWSPVLNAILDCHAAISLVGNLIIGFLLEVKNISWRCYFDVCDHQVVTLCI